MTELSAAQRELVDSLARRLALIPGMAAVVLGGSFARGRALASSDIDLGLLYREAAPFDVADVRALAAEGNDSPDPVVTDFYAWGPWVNGGAWLTVKGQRVDFLYRSLEHFERVVDDAHAGRFELHYGQQPPFGFFSPTYLGELAICVPLFDPNDLVGALKRRVSVYPDALRRAVVQRYLWSAEFSLDSFAAKFAARGDVPNTAGCLARVAHELALVLFALNGRYWLSDKTALEEIAELERAPREFGPRVTHALGALGETPAELGAQVAAVEALTRETVRLCEPLYRRPFPKP
ncbi:MAG TPA: nucleotidyltransferase domain-containing protein [Myxococcota bacterium]|nr:nucleotidyltransferase domain-containing protein [Myxococcota bacterium]